MTPGRDHSSSAAVIREPRAVEGLHADARPPPAGRRGATFSRSIHCHPSLLWPPPRVRARARALADDVVPPASARRVSRRLQQRPQRKHRCEPPASRRSTCERHGLNRDAERLSRERPSLEQRAPCRIVCLIASFLTPGVIDGALEARPPAGTLCRRELKPRASRSGSPAGHAYVRGRALVICGVSAVSSGGAARGHRVGENSLQSRYAAIPRPPHKTRRRTETPGAAAPP